MVFLGRETFNTYSHALISNPLVVPVEIGLVVVFLIHLFKAIRMTFQNQSARPAKYAKKDVGRRRQPEEPRVLVDDPHRARDSDLRADSREDVQVRHLLRRSATACATSTGRRRRTSARPSPSRFYVVMMVLVGLHLWHGVPSSFQSLGLNGPRFTPLIRKIGKVSAVVIAGGFIVITLWVFLVGGRS